MSRDGRDSTITSLGPRGPIVTGRPDLRPELVVLAISDDLAEPSARHVLADVDEVWFARGERDVERRTVDRKRILQLRIPDRRMSSDHGRLVRGPQGWVLDDPHSKNGAVVGGMVTRRAVIDDGTIFELGHTFLLFRVAPATDAVAADTSELELEPGPLATFDGALATRFAALDRIAPTGIDVVVEGETGTGKELIARALHARSGRVGAFVAVNCGALAPNLVEAELFGHRRGAFTGAIAERVGFVRSAEAGTLFLDEIGELPMESQAALLRVLQEREVIPVGGERPVKVDIRLCVATLRDLEAMATRGEFRNDLYGRLYGFRILLPPLRGRKGDLGLLVRRLLARIPKATGAQIAPTAFAALLRHPWPLNIRELDRVLSTAVALSDDVIELEHLPEAFRPRLSIMPAVVAKPGDPLQAQLVDLLTIHRGNLVAVSRAIGARRTQVYRWLRRFGIDAATFR